MSDEWVPIGPSVEAAFEECPDPLRSLARGDVPAILFPGVYDSEEGRGLIQRFIDRGLMDDPKARDSGGTRRRIDIGTSLGNKGNDKEGFFEHAKETHELFKTLFDGFTNPIATLYDHLQTLSGLKRVVTAYEPDGRTYGPAIFRVHYEGHRYVPHIDHVTLREKRFNYAVTRFVDQFAGILCLRNDSEQNTTQSILHHCLWSPEVQPYLQSESFYSYAEERGIERFRVDLEPGDLYFFNTRLIHEVPALEGDNARIVLAAFIGYSEDDNEIFVWS